MNLSNRYYPVIISMFIILLTIPGTGIGQTNTCILCHQELYEELSGPVAAMKNDIHTQKGLSCADCHGGDPTIGFEELDYTISMDPNKGYIGVPKQNEIPQFCAKCHSDSAYMKKFNPAVRTDQLEQYKTSDHGKGLIKGDRKVAQCVSCHGAHGIHAVNDPKSPVYPTNIPHMCAKCHSDADYMKNYKIPTDQFDKYQHSIHGIRLLQQGDIRSAPACNSCHGNHGAAPPEIGSVIYACGQCHTQNEQYHRQSPHNEAFKLKNLGDCDACHGHHDVQEVDDTLLGIDQNAICIKCHSAGENGYIAAESISAELEEFKIFIHESELEMNRTEQYGRDVSLARQKIQQAQESLIMARTVVHTVSLEKMKSVTEPAKAITKEAIQISKDATLDLAYRYVGLVLFIIVSLLIIGLIYLKIKQLEK